MTTAHFEVSIPPCELHADLRAPPRPRGVVIFAHGSGSSRMSPRNRAVADALIEAGFATLLFDLLTTAEAADRANVFDIDLLGRRLGDAISWVRSHPSLAALPIGLFGASTGAAAAIAAAASRPADISAVVSRGGRPDLAKEALEFLRAPTLLIVGGEDTVVIELNEAAQRRMTNLCEMKIIPGATHLFEEPGALEQVTRLAADWFTRHLRATLSDSPAAGGLHRRGDDLS